MKVDSVSGVGDKGMRNWFRVLGWYGDDKDGGDDAIAWGTVRRLDSAVGL